MARSVAGGSPLRNPAYQRLWLRLSISYQGDRFTTIALLWFVLPLTHRLRLVVDTPHLIRKAAVFAAARPHNTEAAESAAAISSF